MSVDGSRSKKLGSSRIDGAGVHAPTLAASASLPVLVGLIKPFIRQLLLNDQGHCHEVILQSQMRCSGNSHSSGGLTP